MMTHRLHHCGRHSPSQTSCLRWFENGFHGNILIKTPFLDNLVKEDLGKTSHARLHRTMGCSSHQHTTPAHLEEATDRGAGHPSLDEWPSSRLRTRATK